MKQIILQSHSKKPIFLNLSDKDCEEVMEYKHYLESIVEEEISGSKS